MGSATEFTGKHTDFIKQAGMMDASEIAYGWTRKEEPESCGGMGNWILVKTFKATNAEEKCLFWVVRLWSSIWRQVVNKDVMWWWW
jgi:hypothetical protein